MFMATMSLFGPFVTMQKWVPPVFGCDGHGCSWLFVCATMMKLDFRPSHDLLTMTMGPRTTTKTSKNEACSLDGAGFCSQHA
jgi:hypothetical protein